MEETMIQPVYRRELSHSYLVIEHVEAGLLNNYRFRMLINNRIPGLLPCSERYMEGEASLYYDISSRQSLGQLCELGSLSFERIRSIIDNMTQIQQTLAEYLLEEQDILMDPTCIFMDLESEQLFFLLYPDRERKVSIRAMYLPIAEFFLEHVDHTDDRAVQAAYQFYKLSKSDSFVLETFRSGLERMPAARPEKKSDVSQEWRYGRGLADQYGVPLAAGAFLEEPATYGPAAPKVISMEAQKKTEHTLSNGEEKDSKRHKAQKTQKMQKEQKENAGSVWRMPWSGLMLLSGSAFLGLCFLLWYLYLPAYGRYSMYAGLVVTGGIFLSALWQFLTDGEELREEEEAKHSEPALPHVEAEPLVALREPTPAYGRFPMDPGAQPTVYMGPGSGWIGLKPHLTTLDDTERQYDLSELPIIVGKLKSRAGILLNDASVSRIHARILEWEGQVSVMDLNSMNGTYINGMRLEQQETVPLAAGDEIRFGEVRLRYDI